MTPDKRGPTPSQTIGPFFEPTLLDRDRSRLVAPDHPSAVRIEGTVRDGAGEAVPDAMLEIWQADAQGRYASPGNASSENGFSGFGRCGTDPAGGFAFVTVKPGPVPVPGGAPGGASGGAAPQATQALQAPHVSVSVFARGLLKRLATRIYFPDEEEANAADPVLASIEDPGLRSTLVALETGTGALRFDVRLQGDGQTAFFDV